MPNVESWLLVLGASGADVICIFPGADASLIQRFQTPRMQIFPMAALIESLLPTTNLVIGYGSGTIATALLSGIPLLLVPPMAKHSLLHCASRLWGASMAVRGNGSQVAYSAAIRTVLFEPRFREAATRFAKKYHDFDPGRAADFIATTIQGVLKHR